MPVTSAQAGVLAGFDAATRDAMLTDLGVADTATSGAITLSTRVTLISVTGAVAFTLPDGTIAGQRKRLQCVTAASIPVGTLTVTTPESATGIVCPSTFIFDTVGQSIDFVWSGTKWQVEKTTRAGAKTAVVGTTALTGFNLCHTLLLSVTGTVSSTGANSVPNGAYPGDRLLIGQSVAASIPVGNINFTGFTLANVAATDLQAWGALTDTVTLEWRGTGWVVAANSGVTVA
jgi:hypothetical protein